MKRSEYLRNAHELFKDDKIGMATYEAMIENVELFTDEPDLEDMTIGELLNYSTYEDSWENEYVEEVCRRARMSDQYEEAAAKDFWVTEKENVEKVVQQAAKQFNHWIV